MVLYVGLKILRKNGTVTLRAEFGDNFFIDVLHQIFTLVKKVFRILQMQKQGQRSQIQKQL